MHIPAVILVILIGGVLFDLNSVGNCVGDFYLRAAWLVHWRSMT